MSMPTARAALMAFGMIVALPAFAGERPPAVERRVPADYPRWARGTGLGTSVMLRIVVASDGRIARVSVVPYTVKDDMLSRELRASFDSAAVACARRWTYRPARRDGRPVAGRLSVEIPFEDPGLDSLAADSAAGTAP